MGNRAIKKSQSPASSDVCDEEEPTSGGRLTARRLRHHPGAAASGLSQGCPPAEHCEPRAPAPPAMRGTASLWQTRKSRGPEPAIPPFHTLSSAFSQRRSKAATSPPSVPRRPPFSHPAGFARSRQTPRPPHRDSGRTASPEALPAGCSPALPPAPKGRQRMGASGPGGSTQQSPPPPELFTRPGPAPPPAQLPRVLPGRAPPRRAGAAEL